MALAYGGNKEFILLTQFFSDSGVAIDETKIQAWSKLKYPVELEKDMEEILKIVGSDLAPHANLQYKTQNTADKQGASMENKDLYIALQTIKPNLGTYLLVTWDVDTEKLAQSVLKLKQTFMLLEVEPEVSVFLRGTIDKRLEQKEQEQIARQVLQKFTARQVEGISLPEMVSLTGYSPYLTDYLQVGHKKINLNVATSFDEVKNQTIIRLGTPLLNGEY
jgi:hypothetical protein